MSIKLIAAVDENYAIGNNNDLLFNVPTDMKHFKNLTTGQIIVYGRKTFESLPNKQPLNNRINVMLTRNLDYKTPTSVIKMNSVENIINHYNSGEQDKDIWIIGGSEVYKQFLPFVDEAHITQFHAKAEVVDKWFPNEYLEEYFSIEEKEFHEDVKTNMKLHFIKYVRNS